MLSQTVRRSLSAAALVLVLGSVPALAAPAARPYAPRVPVTTGVPLLDRLLDWLGSRAREVAPAAPELREKTSGSSSDGGTDSTRVQMSRGVLIDPNG